MRPSTLIVTGALCSLLSACASSPRPNEELAKAHTLVEQAEKSQAQQYAAADLQRARDELRDAELANGKGKYDVARSDAESASVDADLASARAAEGAARRSANDARQSNAVLQHEERNAAGTAVTPQSDVQPYPPAPPAPAAPASAMPPVQALPPPEQPPAPDGPPPPPREPTDQSTPRGGLT